MYISILIDCQVFSELKKLLHIREIFYVRIESKIIRIHPYILLQRHLLGGCQELKEYRVIQIGQLVRHQYFARLFKILNIQF